MWQSKRIWVAGLIVTGLALGLTKGLAVRQVIWDGDAPVSFGVVAAINERLIGSPLLSVTSSRILKWLTGELVEKVQVRWKLPSTVVIIAEAPELIGVIPKQDKGILVDAKGRIWGKVPLWATRLPILLLPDGVPIQKCIAAIRRTQNLCAQQKVPVKAIWVSRFGEVAIFPPDGGWLRLGNPFALRAKLQLGENLRRQGLIKPNAVADLALPEKISLWELSQPNP